MFIKFLFRYLGYETTGLMILLGISLSSLSFSVLLLKGFEFLNTLFIYTN